MRVCKLIALTSVLTIFAWGCELDDTGSDATGGGVTDDTGGGGTVDPCPTCTSITSGKYDLNGDGNCDQTKFWDVDCETLPDDQLDLPCPGQWDKCNYTVGRCEAARPCENPWKLSDGDVVVRACPNDSDCYGAGAPNADGMAVACASEGQCDTWCGVHPVTGELLDADCEGNVEAAKYCTGANGELACP